MQSERGAASKDLLAIQVERFDRAGTRPGQVVAMPATDPAQLFITLCAAAHRRLALLPLPPELPLSHRQALLARSGTEWLASPDGSINATGFATSNHVSDTGLRLLVLTSGSSGPPRAVMLGADNLAAAAAAASSHLGLQRGDRWLACLPPQHIGGLAPFYRCAWAGATLVTGSGLRGAALMRNLLDHGITHVSLVPAMLARLLEQDPAPPPRLRVALIGGQALDPALAAAAHAAGWPVCVSYGLSEAGSMVACDRGPGAGILPGRVGRPLPGLQLQAGTPLAPAPVRLRGPTLMRGYANPQRQGGDGLVDGWFITGDLGYLDHDPDSECGSLVLLGRADDVLVSGGVNVQPASVEAKLGACPGIGRVGVTGLPDPRWGQRLVALYTGPARPDAVEHWCRQNLATAERPRRFVPLPALPLLGPGKLDRRRLRELAAQSGAAATSR